MNLDDWVRHGRADAERRDLPQLAPLLETLARATRVLRNADWNTDASIETSTPSKDAAAPKAPPS